MISVNSVFKYVDVEDGERIRIIELDENYVYIVNIDAVTSMPRKESVSKIAEEIECNKLIKIKDPYIKIIEDKELSEVQLNKRNEDWQLIEKYWQLYKDDILNKSNRVKSFESICNESNNGMNKVKRLFSRFWQRGMNKNALIPDYDKSGGRGKEKKLNNIKTGKPRKADYLGNKIDGINITEDVKKQFAFAIDKYYRNNKKGSLKETYTLILKDFYSDSFIEENEIKYRVWDDSRIPTYDQFYYWFKKKENIKKDIIFRESEKEFNLKHRQLLSNSTQETDGPGTRFQVDATIADVYLVSSLNRNRVIGRPVVYAIIDVFSRIVTGIYVGLEGPSWIGAMMALDNMIANKVEYCKEYGIEISDEQWPCRHLPEIIIADRGEFEGYNVENLINNLNVKIENTSPYRGDLKGIVERRFRTTNEKIKHKTPGAIQKEYRKRGDRDYRLDATLTLEEFTKIYINIVLHNNSKIIDKYPMDKEMIADEITAVPINLWNWGIENRKGRLKTVDREVLRLNILPKGKASVSRAGIRFKGLYYSSDKAVKEQWFVNLKVRSIEVVYDPRNMSKIYIPYNNGLDYDECYLIDASLQYKDCLLEEIIFNEDLDSELKDKALRDQNQNNIDLEREIDRIVKQAKKEKAKDINYNTSPNQKLKGIKNNRAIEKEINRQDEGFNLGKDIEKSDRVAEVIELPIAKIENGETGYNKLMDLIKKKRGEKSGK
ncbi:UNVERIFIED_ORG: transposase [Clostridium botulinum]|uniref:Mu transposase C-terminal domain-containing protein n=1 Tax=Clostridium botulinum TaxID=1491 RepID=UPI000597A831|nr:Mu transposase C-terminal domain-containing protein [Clostridium botulinum]KIL08625.1 transposase [Clostridium botulinum]MBY6934910.1 DDE-type integrase/transposase/recombinase [Clostridium botulinum]NFL82395.1 DDE-type integrase/transposase/recombinase [Clostridium botulinum]NFN11965.1 DDE-type integrase/transposase/recombinase [Clostridium botulinum]NFO36745.1 DDE-type integrase/transposase/recombinase [Clostridium botulinum]